MRLKIDPPTILEVLDTSTGLTGWLAVDSIIDHHFCGGLRMLPDVSPAELSELAKAMTLKHSFLGLPHGGAKAGIVYDESRQKPEKPRLLTAFGRSIEDLLRNRIYLPGSDMGTNGEEIRRMLETIGIRVPKRTLMGKRSGWYTSLTVVASLKAAAEYQGIDLAKASVAIEGFGSVGSAVAEGLRNLGCRVVAISTYCGALYSPKGLDVNKLIECYRQHGSTMVDFFYGPEKIRRELLPELDVDVFVPCARHHSINIDNASRIKAALIGCGANVPATKEAEKLLWQRGILCVPDFVANAGGVLGGTMEFAGIRPSSIAEFVDRNFSRQVSILIGTARKEGAYIRDKAEAVAAERRMRVKPASESRSFRNRIFSFGLDLYRNGMIPATLVGTLSRKYFRRRLEGKV
jgi:glutamate dehydrogenase (NAD(P)+)